MDEIMITPTGTMLNQQNTYSSLVLKDVLNVSSQHSHWIARAITRAKLVENQDYVAEVENDSSGKSITVYYLTEDAALQIAMMQSSVEGEAVRKYFLQLRRDILAYTESKLSIAQNQVKVLTLAGSITEQARQQNYLTAMEIKELLELSTSSKIITEVGSYYAVPSIQAGIRTFWSVKDWISAWKEWRTDSIPVGTVTYEHLFTGSRWESK